MTNFVSLHNHTDYSILDSLTSTKELFDRAKELGQTAIAVTDHGTFAAAWDALKYSNSTGVKLIIGCEYYFQDDNDKPAERLRHIILLAKNAVGYRNLLTINKKGFDHNSIVGKKAYSIIDWKLLEEYKEGVICLTACGNGIINQLLMNKKFDEAEQALLRLKTIFGDNLGLEIQPNNMKRGSNVYNDMIDQKYLNNRNIDYGKKYNIKVVPTCNSHYINKEDSDTHDVLLSIGSHQTKYSNFRLKYPVQDFYLKSGDEVKDFFSRNYGEEFAEQLCENSLYFADMCEKPIWIDPKHTNPSGKELPKFPVKDQSDYNEFLAWSDKQDDNVKILDEDKRYLRYICDINLTKRVPNLNESNIDIYKDRIKEELDVLEFHGFSSYMLIVADYVDWARKHGIPVSQGRGSVGGSLIGYLANIHQADPIKYGLIFARFHNKEKTSYPDIDMDIATSGREAVKVYLRNKYGEDHVAHVSNVNTITPKVYVRDISRVLELGGSRDAAVKLGNEVADCIPAEIHNIDEALAKCPLFTEYCKKYPEYIKYKNICGKYRALSTHAGGTIVSKRSLVGLIPLRRDKDGVLALEYDKDKAESNGLVKMDILGLSTLDIIGETHKLIKQSNKEIPIIDCNEYDKLAYDLISAGDTFCVFQLGTSIGTIDLCRRVKPSLIEEISHINSLARPSAKDMRNDFIDTKKGKKPVTLLHPKLQRSFGNTYGFGLYEECLMYLAQDIAGWSLHSADRLRKLTKDKGKNPEKVVKLRQEFIDDSVKNGIDINICTRIWDEVVSGFGGYGFNKSLYEHQRISTYTNDGKFLKEKHIKDIKKGDYVRSRDENTKKYIFIKVIDKYDHGKLPLVEVELTTGEKVKCTITHKFRVKENGEMLPLSTIIDKKLTIITTDNLEISNIKSITYVGEGQTYDLEVDHKDHQFYLSNGILTSNSHSTLYSMISFQTAYLKAHYPVEFLLANLMAEVNSNTKDAKVNIEKIKKELKSHNIKIKAPDINRSQLTYTVQDNELITGLDALKFVGTDAIQDIISKRPFSSFLDFMVRVDSKKVRANTIQALIATGCLDSFNISRKLMFLYCSDYRKKLQVWLKKHDPSKEEFIFPWSNIKTEESQLTLSIPTTNDEWSLSERYALEYFYLNEAFCCKPAKAYNKFFVENHNLISQISKKEDKKKLPSVRAIIRDTYEFKVKKEGSKFYGCPMLKTIIEDMKGDQCACTIFPDTWKRIQERMKMINSKAKFEAGLAIQFSGTVNVYEDKVGIIIDNLIDLALPPAMPADLKAKKISLKDAKTNPDVISKPDTIEEFVIDAEEALYNEGFLELDDLDD